MNSNLKSISRSFMSGMKMVESKASTLSTDKNVLYIMLVIAVVNIIGYLIMGNFEAVVFFAIVAYLSTFFTKNMVIVFLISILATNFLMVSKVNYFRKVSSKEGMQNKDAKADKGDAADADADAKADAADAKPSASPSPSPSPSPDAGKKQPKPTKSNSKKTSGEKKKENMNGKLAPAKFNDDEDDDDDVEESAAPFPGTAAQKNKQMEKAYDSLHNISNGAGGAMKLQTEEVMKQQKILMDNMKTMQPFLETAERFLDKFNMKGIDGLLGKIGLGGASPASSATPSASS